VWYLLLYGLAGLLHPDGDVTTLFRSIYHSISVTSQKTRIFNNKKALTYESSSFTPHYKDTAVCANEMISHAVNVAENNSVILCMYSYTHRK